MRSAGVDGLATQALVEAARAAAAEPFSPAEASPLHPALIQKMWWGWVKGHPAQLPHEKLFLFLRLEDVGVDDACTAIRALIARHATLRSRFAEEGGALRLDLNDAGAFEVEVARVDGGADLEAGVEAERVRFCARDLRIEGEWLSRARVVASGDADILIVMAFHHMIFDARSRLLVEQELRQRLVPGADPGAAPGPAAQFIDYAAWERDWLARTGEALSAYWRGRLRALPALRNPGGGEALRWRPGHKAYYDFELAGEGVTRMRALSQASTPFKALMAATAVAVARWAGQERFVLRVVGDQRTTRPMPDMIGNLVCTDLTEMCVAPGSEVGDVLDAAAEGYRAATRLRCPNLLGLPDSAAFPDVADDSVGGKTAVTLNYMPLFRFKADDGPAPAPGRPIATRIDQRDFWPTPVCPINLRIWDWGGRMVCRMEFDDDVIAEADQRRLIALFIDAVYGPA